MKPNRTTCPKAVVPSVQLFLCILLSWSCNCTHSVLKGNRPLCFQQQISQHLEKVKIGIQLSLPALHYIFTHNGGLEYKKYLKCSHYYCIATKLTAKHRKTSKWPPSSSSCDCLSCFVIYFMSDLTFASLLNDIRWVPEKRTWEQATHDW